MLMKRNWRNICVGHLLLVVLVMVLHSTISHHHHFETAAAHCYSLATNDSTSEADSRQCHVLNDITVERASNLSKLTAVHSYVFILDVLQALPSIDEPLVDTTLYFFQIVPPEQRCIGSVGFRGPPIA